jgi:hypothetical protein
MLEILQEIVNFGSFEGCMQAIAPWVVGALLGVGKSELIDRPQYMQNIQREAIQERYGTRGRGGNFSSIKRPDTLGSAVAGGIAAQQLAKKNPKLFGSLGTESQGSPFEDKLPYSELSGDLLTPSINEYQQSPGQSYLNRGVFSAIGEDYAPKRRRFRSQGEYA